MKIGFQDFSPNIPHKNRYERGVDYLWHDFDLEFEDAFYLLEKLKTNRSGVIVYTPSVIVHFYLFDNLLCVQIDGDGFWHQTNIDLESAREILRTTYEGCNDFGSQVPNTNREWDSYPLWTDTLK